MSDKKKQCIENVVMAFIIIYVIILMLILNYYSWDILKNMFSY